MSFKSCSECGSPVLVGGRKRYTPDSFKKEFKVGDYISGWNTEKVGKITAIGVKRFLYMDASGAFPEEKDVVSTMNISTGWRKVKK